MGRGSLVSRSLGGDNVLSFPADSFFRPRFFTSGAGRFTGGEKRETWARAEIYVLPLAAALRTEGLIVDVFAGQNLVSKPALEAKEAVEERRDAREQQRGGRGREPGRSAATFLR